ncbi:FAD linked oxidase domain protein [Haladaptatus paucihalophilus DX253]|uniref:FAD linked oxidase domain protein n=1 Tax=Haladaptatus paucihalophilus DX253 TaxID=797209 RepID=E7QX26_HALPU|nr:FAD-binding oxidoreductase [Haladaptatus paucihalophilus]EFW90829.1 FAD linked oxidase domain protein [Haladaptatus paucihalophilus DX253]SHK23285.1 FAD/FMN-containing dehydrogenase [Haladaptatus paucihalophilus DX253]
MGTKTHQTSEDGTIDERFRGRISRPGDARYEEDRIVWNGMRDAHPDIIARCSGVGDVKEAVEFARETDIPVAVRGGGHNVAGTAVRDGGLVIDLSEMRSVTVDPEHRRVRAQGGATWADVDWETQAFGLVAPGGVVSETGIAGLTLGGGYGWTRRKLGLTCDSLVSADVITGEGAFVHASEGEHEDLLWALRGGGSGVGVVTSFEYECLRLGPEVFFLGALYPLDDGEAVLSAWREFMTDAPDEITVDALIWSVPPDPMFPEELHGTPFISVVGMYAGPPERGPEAMQPLREIGTPLLDLSGPMPYLQVQSMLDAAFPDGDRYYWKSHYLAAFGDDETETILDFARRRPSPRTLVPIRSLGGEIARVGSDETAFGDRSAAALLSIDGTWEDPADDAENVAWVREFWDATKEYSTGATYVNFSMLEGDEASRTSFTANEERLAAVKERYDPDGVFAPVETVTVTE